MKDDFEIMTPDEVFSLMPPSVPKSWVYAHWGELGGVKIGKRKLILREVLYGNLQKEGLVVCPDREGQHELDTGESRNGRDPVEKETGRQTRRCGAETKGRKVENHSNEFGLIDALQRVS